MSFMASWTDRFKPCPHTLNLGGPTSMPSNNVVCLLKFAWRWTRIAMALGVKIWCLGYSETSVMSDLILNIRKTSQVRWKLILALLYKLYIIVKKSISCLFMETWILRVSCKVNVKRFGLHLLCKRPEVFMIPWTFKKSIYFLKRPF